MWLVAIVSLFKLIAEQLPRFQKRVPDEPQNVLFQAQETSFARQRERTVVLPATEPNADFCRTVFSLLINGYGTPTVVSVSW